MKKYLFLFNTQTLSVVCVTLISSYLSLQFHFSMYIDFVILGLVIAFPLTLTIKEAFRRRERAIQSLSGLKASLMTLFYSFENRNLDSEKKAEFKNILLNLSGSLTQYLAHKKNETLIVQRSSESIVRFIRTNNETLKKPFSLKLLFYLQRVNEDIEFLSATKNHRTPKGIRAIILFAIYAFVIFYPASLLKETGFNVPLWYVFAMSVFKSIVLISLYNAQVLLEDPFNQESPEGIRLNDFQFTGWIDTPVELEAAPVKNKKIKKETMAEEDGDDDE
ncbi:MAG TPA: hypothetical protein PLA68_02585 [Panacibacter sp.]|nr:hypothetical protein [Panacibacter sp.]